MRVLSVRLENEVYDSFAVLATGAGKPPEELATDVLAAWIESRRKEAARGSEVSRAQYVERRLRGEDVEVGADVAAGWDREIRTDPAAWSGAFMAASKGSDPLTWEMTTRERFYGLWGHRPKSGG